MHELLSLTHAADNFHIEVYSHLYSFSFEPNANWTRQFPGQEEIQRYLVDVAHKYQLYKCIRFNTSVAEARWDEDAHKWCLTISRLGGKDAEFGSTYTVNAEFLVSAVGQLNVPKSPNIEGLDDFRGKVMHSARWDWDYDLRGKKIGIIGTGATATQIIPEVVQPSSSLVVFQRTPAWVLPRHDAPISKIMQWIYKYIPFVRKRYRARLMDLRESAFDAAFDTKSSAHASVTSISRQHMLTQLGGKVNASLREQLTPDYPFSCKRITLSDDLYPTMTQGKVFLETRQILSIGEKGVTVGGRVEHELDLLILATGFHTTEFMVPMKVTGGHGRSLDSVWSKGASAYLGMTVKDMPNFAMLYGPNTNLAYNSLILQIEAQSLYINTLISEVLAAKHCGESLRLEPKEEVVTKYNHDIQSRLSVSTYADPRCTSWFKNDAGLITNNWCDSAIMYQKRVCFVDWSDYHILGTAAANVRQKGETRWKRVVEETWISDTKMGVVFGVTLSSFALALLLYKLSDR